MVRQVYGGVAAAVLKYAGAMRVELRAGDTLYLPALWLHDIQTVAVAEGISTRASAESADLDSAKWPMSVSYACRFEPRCLRHPPRRKRKTAENGAARHRQQQEP